MKKIKVSACVITYNQEDFLRKCLDGAISQIVNFDYEIVIGDDFSSDLSEQISREYAAKYPNLIRYKKRKNNTGMIHNWQKTILECRGNYIAICEGDDYWTDPYKLQKQVDFLESNPEYVLTFHPVLILHPDGQIKEDHITNVPKNHETIESLAIYGNYIHTPSVVFRNVIKKFPEKMNESPIGDYFIYMLLAEFGKLKKLDDAMAVYRYGIGVHSSLSDQIQNEKWRKTLSLIHSEMKNNAIRNILYYKIEAEKLIERPYWLKKGMTSEQWLDAENLAPLISLKKLGAILKIKIFNKFRFSIR